MSAQPASARGHLRVVEIDDNGEFKVLDSDALASLEEEAEKLREDRKNLERDIRAKRRRIAELERDRARERLEHPRYDDAIRVAKYWWRKCKGANPRVNYQTPDRIDPVLALMDIEEIVVDADTKKRRREPHYSLGHFKAAIDGAAFDPFITTHRNGKQERHNDLSQICKDATRFDRFIAKSPKPPVTVDTQRDMSTLQGEGSKHAATSAAHRFLEGSHGQDGRVLGVTDRGFPLLRQAAGSHVRPCVV